MDIIKKIDEWFEKILKLLMILSVLIMTGVLSLGVFYRIFLSSSITASSEICNYCILIITFGCSVLVVRKDKQVKISYLFDSAKWRLKRIWAMVINLGMAVLMGYSGYFAFGYAMQNMNLGRTSAVLGIPICAGIFIVAFGILLMAVEYFIEFVLTAIQKEKIYIGRTPIIKGEEL